MQAQRGGQVGAGPGGPVVAPAEVAAVSTGPGRPRPVVLADVDGSRSGRVALEVAARRAAALGADLVGVHVPPALPLLWSFSPELIARAPAWRADLEADAFFDTAAAAGRVGVAWSFTVARGPVAAALARQARSRGAALVVVAAGTRHRRPHRCPALRLAAACDRPVLVAGAGGGAPGGSPR